MIFVGIIYTSRVATKILLAYVLANFYAVAVILIVCQYAKACCGMANATAEFSLTFLLKYCEYLLCFVLGFF